MHEGDRAGGAERDSRPDSAGADLEASRGMRSRSHATKQT